MRSHGNAQLFTHFTLDLLDVLSYYSSKKIGYESLDNLLKRPNISRLSAKGISVSAVHGDVRLSH